MKPDTGLLSLSLLILFTGSFTSFSAAAAPIQAVIENVPDTIGAIRVAICTENEFLKPSCKFHAEVRTNTPETTVTFADIPSGIYAIQAFQDRNSNARLDRSFIGIPQEPIGFSRNPVIRFGPPSFEDCAVTITEGGGSLRIKLITH